MILLEDGNDGEGGGDIEIILFIIGICIIMLIICCCGCTHIMFCYCCKRKERYYHNKGTEIHITYVHSYKHLPLHVWTYVNIATCILWYVYIIQNVYSAYSIVCTYVHTYFQ